MAAPQVNSVDQESSPSGVRHILEFAKYQKENPELDTDQAVKGFLGVSFQNPFSNPPETIQRSPAIQIRRDFATPAVSKPGSCPQASSMPPLAGMSHGNLNQTRAQNAFAIRAGRSPQSFPNTTPVAAFSSSFPETLHTNTHQYATGPPSFQTLQSLGIDSTPTLQEYLSQNDKHEPFPLARHAVGESSFSEARTNKGHPPLSIDPTLEIFSAPQMRPQLSSSASEYPTGCDEGYIDSPHSFTYPMNRHSRSYSHGSSLLSSSQPESESPTDPYYFRQHGESNPMSRQASGTSFIHGGLSMLRVQSSTGSSGDVGDSTGGIYGVANHDMDNLLSGIGQFVTENDDDLSSINKASAQVVLKRPSSMSVDDLNASMAAARGQAEHYSTSTGSNGQSKPRKQKRVKGEVGEEEEKVEVDCLRQQNLSTAKQGIKVESETTTKTNTRPTTSRQSEKKSHGGSGARPLPTIKPGKNPNSPPLATSKSCYIRPPHPRVHCTKCNAKPEGFRGDHELRRHTDREHEPTRKMYIIKDISEGKMLLAKCKACQSGKKYGVDYNAAAHLRRQHFKPKEPKVPNGKNKQKATTTLDHTAPEMAELRKWMVEVEVPNDQNSYYKKDQSRESGDSTHPKEDEGDTSEESEEEETQQVDGDTTYQETASHKGQQQDHLDFMQGIELEVDLTSGQPQRDLVWACSSWSGSTVNNATYTLSNPKMPQQLTHHFGSHISTAAGSAPLIGGGLNQQNIAIHLPAQHQMLMQDDFHLQQLPYFTDETCSTGDFGQCLPATSSRAARFNNDTISFLIFPETESDINPL